MKNFKNILFVVLLFATTLFATSCKSLKTSESKDEIKRVASAIVDVSLDFTAYKFSKELKPISVPLRSDTVQNITFIDKFGFVKLDKFETPDSLFLEFTPVWVTLRDTIYAEAVKHSKTQSGFIKDVIALSLNLAMIEASEKVGSVVIKLPKYNFEERSFSSRNKIIIVKVCPDDKCLILSLDAFAFSDFLKRLSQDKIFKL